ncbi:MAG: hypothetical protein ACLP8S_04325 [Solirubrobacteraceae bacterium]
MLKVAIGASLQAARVLDGPAAVAYSGSLGRGNGTIGFDGVRSCAGADRHDRNAAKTIVRSNPPSRLPVPADCRF